MVYNVNTKAILEIFNITEVIIIVWYGIAEMFNKVGFTNLVQFVTDLTLTSTFQAEKLSINIVDIPKLDSPAMVEFIVLSFFHDRCYDASKMVFAVF